MLWYFVIYEYIILRIVTSGFQFSKIVPGGVFDFRSNGKSILGPGKEKGLSIIYFLSVCFILSAEACGSNCINEKYTA
jgi:hypothetical protein